MGSCAICCSVCLFIIGVPLFLGGVFTMVFKQDIIDHITGEDRNDLEHRVENAAEKIGNTKELKPYKDAAEGIINVLAPTTQAPFLHDPEQIVQASAIASMVIGGLMVLCGLILCCRSCCSSNKPGQTIIHVPVPMTQQVTASTSRQNLLQYQDDPPMLA